MAYNNNENYQALPFWEFARAFDNSGAGVDHPAHAFWGPPGPPPPPHDGSHPPPPPPVPGFGFFGGRGGFGYGGPRGGRRGRHAHRHEGPHAEGSRTVSPDGEKTDEETREGEARESGPEHTRRGPRHGRCGGGARGWGHHRGGWGGHGRRGGWGDFGGTGAPFDLNALLESLSAHPLAQAYRTYADQAAAQRSGETGIDADTDDSFTPPIDTFSTENAYVLHIAIPGAKKEDVGINWDADKGTLSIAGVVYRNGDEEFLKTLTKGERKVGVFERTVKLPPSEEDKEEIDSDNITAKLEDGVLVVTVLKVEKEWTEIKRVDIE